MGGTDEIDPFGVVPDGFCEAWGEESIPAALEAAERAPGVTPDDVKERCNRCRTTRLRLKPGYQEMPHKIDTKYACSNGHHVAENDTRPPLAECPVEYAWKWLDKQQMQREKFLDTMPINTPFRWLSSTDLKDPADRGMGPLFEGLDEERRTELALRLYRPWTEAGPSYRELAELFPHSRPWIGSRVRAWEDGEYRDLVEEPAPTVDDTGADAIATDGGERDRRRWAAYGEP